MPNPFKNNTQLYYAQTSISENKCYQVVHVQLTDLDNDPDHFWKTFANALSYWDIQIAQKEKQFGFPKSPENILRFLSEIGDILQSSPLILEISSSQRVHDQKVKSFLKDLVEANIPQLLVLLLSDCCNDKNLSEVIQENKFRYFTIEEERTYYKSNSSSLDDQTFGAIRNFTNGWANAVIILTQHLGSDDHRRRIIDDFNAYFLNWLERYAIEKYSQEEQDLFVCLSLLDEFPLNLPRSLGGWNERFVMDVLETSPFLQRNAETGCFFYAKHVRQYLLQHQDLLDKKQQKKFLIQAGDWYREHDLRIDAISCYRKAGSNTKILQIIMQWTFPMSLQLAECYFEAISAMPVSFTDSHPLLHIIQSYTLCTMYRYDEAQHRMEEFCLKHDKGEDTPAELRSILGEAYVLWTHIAFVKSDSEKLLKRSKRASELLPNGSTLVRGKVNRMADTCLVVLPSPEADSVQRSLKHIQQWDRYSGIAFYGTEAGVSNLAAAEMHFYTRNFKETERFAHKIIVDALSNEQYDAVCSAHFLLMRCNLAKGNYQKLIEHYNYLKTAAKNANYDTFFSMPDLAHSWLALRLGKKHEVADWIIDMNNFKQSIKPWNLGRNLVLCGDYLLQSHSFVEAVSLAEKASDLMMARGQKFLALYLWVIQAIAHQHLEEDEDAVHILDSVYQWTHGNNIIMPIIGFGGNIVPLLSNYQKAGGTVISDAWLAEMKKKAKSYQVYQNNIRHKFQQQQYKGSALETLTHSEQKLLLLVSEGMSIRQIAETQDKSVNAIKVMLHNIYKKIGASNLVDAVRIAVENDIKKYVR